MDDILSKLKDKISDFEYSSYISLMEYDESASRTDMEIFYVPNIFIADWIKSNYLELIADVFEDANSNAIRPEIHIRVKQKSNNVKSLTSNKNIAQSNANHLSLNPYYTFENFVVGKSNEHAHTVAKLVAQQQASAYNPVLFYGKAGLGKTHLLNAIGNYVKEKNRNVLYLSSEDFLIDFLEKIRRGTMDSFRDKYRKCDYFLIDDVQFFGGKEGVQEELLHTFNVLHSNQKQIVMTSDKPPKEIKGLEERLRSRFEWGVMAEITNPELETKIQIIKSKCELNSINLEPEVIDYIASNVHGNIRQFEGILSTINTHANLSPESSKIKIAKNVLKYHQTEKLEGITIENIIKAVGRELNIKPTEITSKGRSKNISFARDIVVYLARSLTLNSMPVIAQKLNLKDHSSVSKSLSRIKKQIEENLTTKTIIEDIRTKIQQPSDSI